MFELHFDIKVEILQGTVNFPEGENTGWPRIVFLFMSSHFSGKEQKPAEASSNGGKFIWKRIVLYLIFNSKRTMFPY